MSRLHYDGADAGKPALVGPVMGAPYAVMLLETLRALGVARIIFFGWCGSIQDRKRIGDILIPDDAIVDEGTSLHYRQNSGDVVQPDIGLHRNLALALQGSTENDFGGRVWSTDAIFRETPEQIQKFQKLGAVAVEMELSSLLSVSRFHGMSSAAVLAVSDELFHMQWRTGFKEKRFKAARTAVCDVLIQKHGSLFHE